MLTELNWRKSSFTLEDNCVEAAWTKSSFSKLNDCVELGACTCAEKLRVRDTKNRAGGTLTVGRTAWSGLLGFARRH